MKSRLDPSTVARQSGERWDSQFSAPGTYVPALDALMQILDAKDGYTALHCRRVRELAQLVAVKMDWQPLMVRTTMLAAYYHDIGKLGICNGVLNKPGRLSPAEREAMQTHPTVGRELIESFLIVQRAAVVIEQHHESWDGSGYPHGAAEDNILPEARILRVCDVYDALVTDRPYRQGYAHDEAAQIIREGIGTEFEPQAAETLLCVTQQLRMAA